MRRRALPLVALLGAACLIAGDRGPLVSPGRRPPSRVMPAPKRIPLALVVVETQGAGGLDEEAAAAGLQVLLAHFDADCEAISATQYQKRQVDRHQYAFYLAGESGGGQSAGFVADLAAYKGIAVWIGGGVSHLGTETLGKMGLSAKTGEDTPPEPADWVISYGGQQHSERSLVPKVSAAKNGRALSSAHRGGRRYLFAAGKEKRWYVAAGPSLAPERVWTACIWADALHDMLAIPHQVERRLVPALRDVPVWVTNKQVPDAARPMMQAGLPVAVLMRAQFQDVAVGDRPAAVEGLRELERMGGTVVLWTDSALAAREHLRLAWECGLHPVAWAGPEGEDNPFRLRIADPAHSPPFSGGGVLPAPITISDAGSIADQDLKRLKMQLVVRDAVALVSFSLWAPRDPFLQFVESQEQDGWRRADLREIEALVSDPRRIMVSGEQQVALPWNSRARKRTLGPNWQQQKEETLAAPQAGQAAPGGTASLSVAAANRCVVVVEPIREQESRAFIKGVTLDPWPYAWQGLSAKVLADSLAERYSRNGVNTVFFYAYNVKQGAAYWTRYPGATMSEWGRQDLLKEMLRACHERQIRVVAWMYSGRDRGVWTEHPSWRERAKDGSPYNPLRLHATYFLCPRNPEVRQWYAGLLRDLAQHYSDLDGIELSEPLVNWWGDTACYCAVCQESFAQAYPGKPLGGAEWRHHRTRGLTEFMTECMRAISEEGVDPYLLTICDMWDNGAPLRPSRQAEESGLDLDALLDSPYPPRFVNFEVIWQQWAAIYGTEVFNYDWAAETTRRLKNRVDGRARTIVHVEITDFGNQHMTPEKVAETIRYVMTASPDGVECYHSAALDGKSAWTVLRRAFEEIG